MRALITGGAGFIGSHLAEGLLATGRDVVTGQSIQEADLVVSRVEAGYVVLGVVMDSDGAGEEVVPPGEDVEVASVKMMCGDGDSRGDDDNSGKCDTLHGVFLRMTGGSCGYFDLTTCRLRCADAGSQFQGSDNGSFVSG